MYLDKELTRQYLGPQLFSAVFLKILKKGQTEQERRVMLAKLVSNDKFFAGGSLKGDRSHLIEVSDISVLKKIQKEKGLLLELNVRGKNILPMIKLGKGESDAKAA